MKRLSSFFRRFQSFFEIDLQSLTAKDIQEEIKKIKSYHSQIEDSISSETLLPIEPEEVEIWLKDVQKMLASIGMKAILSSLIRHDLLIGASLSCYLGLG